MKHLVLYCLLGSLSLGCTEHGMESDSLKVIKSERVITTRLVDMSRWGIHEVNGFVKQGDRIVVETGGEYGEIKTIDLDGPGTLDLAGRGESLNDRFRSLSSFNSFDGLGFQEGRADCEVDLVSRSFWQLGDRSPASPG